MNRQPLKCWKRIGALMRRAAALFTIILLAGCGATQPERAQGGAAGGAATGAAFGLIGGPVGVAVGAVIGGGVGGLAGASTEAKHINLGPPPWSSTN
jgi:phage tail tape-measure protein